MIVSQLFVALIGLLLIGGGTRMIWTSNAKGDGGAGFAAIGIVFVLVGLVVFLLAALWFVFG